MKRKLFLLLCSSLLIMISACSSNNTDHKKQNSSTQHSTESMSDMDQKSETFSHHDMTEKMVNQENESTKEVTDIVENLDDKNAEKLIIRQAQLEIKVKNLEQTQLSMENKVEEYDGYIVESNMFQEDEEHMNAYLSIRIPEQSFQSFLTDTEEVAADILERTVTGEDVTEDYVDLTSRLKSKRVVEERLLSFLQDAGKTEDLLKISTDLATVQEDIEILVGKMDYLENQSAYATINLSMIEDRVIVPDIENKDLNTWENTKKQLAKSFNILISAGSGLIVFLIGNLPIIVILLFILAIIYTIIRRLKNAS